MSAGRVDPPGCVCTDCTVGDSVPLDLATEAQVEALCEEELQDATGMSELEFDVWENGGADVNGMWRTAAELGYAVTPESVRAERQRLFGVVK